MESILGTILFAAGILFVLAIIMALILGWANIAFHVETDPKVDALNEALPGANCGGCGYVGCNEYAVAVAEGKAELTLCGPGGASCVQEIAGIMGQEVKETWPFKAVVHCAAKRDQRLKQQPYEGEKTCAAANLVPGVQGCTYGCLGYGDCFNVCDYGAIDMVEGLAIINPEKCTGCKACVSACPRGIITMVPFKTTEVMVVACSNKDKGPLVKDVCSIGCIGCSACAKPSDGLLTMVDNIPVMDYDKFGKDSDLSKSIEKCPRESLVYIGEPEKKEELKGAPERIEADFETTIDKTDWWG
ncbi:MAG: RnfABCDGE type electron transport complex subunit B [Opitutales bacterium]|nr:RnfABCDGE type electron transport complex subunit B [Opitutales bacterium]